MPESLIPEGFAAYGWHSFKSDLWQGSAAHLVPADSVHKVGGGTVERVYGPALCGRSKRGRSTRHDTPRDVREELSRGERKACTRCFAKAGAGDA